MICKTALVTGGAGFIGSHLVERLSDDCEHVYILDDFSFGSMSLVTKICKKHDNISYLHADVTDFEYCRHELLKIRPNIIYHLACSKKLVGDNDPGRDLEVNGGGTLNMLRIAQELGARFVHASSGSIYGVQIFDKLREDHPVNPTSYYGVSKLAGEKYVRMFHDKFGLDTTILRYFHVYGPRQPSGDDIGAVVSVFVRRMLRGDPVIIYGDGTQIRSFTDVDDVVEATIRASYVPTACGRVMNVASGIQVTINDLAGIICQTLGCTGYEYEYSDVRPVEMTYYKIDNTAAVSLLGMNFNTNMVTGIKRIEKWVLRQYPEEFAKG